MIKINKNINTNKNNKIVRRKQTNVFVSLRDAQMYKNLLFIIDSEMLDDIIYSSFVV